MALYEHESGEVVRTVENSFEDNRIGFLAAEGEGGWKLVEEDEPMQLVTPEQAAVTSRQPSAAETSATPQDKAEQKPGEKPKAQSQKAEG